MEELKAILQKIENTYNMMPGEEKHLEIAKYWTEYYEKSKELGKKLDEAYNLYLMGENESFLIEQEPIRKEIDNEKVNSSLNNLLIALALNEEDNSLSFGINREDVKVLLDWDIEKMRQNISNFGLNLERNSLNGFCELAQYLTIKPFENLGVKTTKNEANIFQYKLNHCFGTVTFPVKENNEIIEDTYLIDGTYRQFFSSIRCNKGRYYTKDENLLIDSAPDIGYFVKDNDFARNLMGTGYFKLDETTAKKYGEAFYLSSLSLKDFDREKDKDLDYYNLIMNNKVDYKIDSSEIDDLDISFPGNNSRKR